MPRHITLFAFLCVSLLCCLVPNSRAQHSQCCGNLPAGILKALTADEREYCDRFLGSYRTGCHDTFRAKLAWRELKITPNGQVAILIENKTSCGSAGCWLGLFLQGANGKFAQALGTDGEVGILKKVVVLKELTNGHFNIEKTWKDGETKTIYRWNGTQYSAD
jgi:hypothetical protein